MNLLISFGICSPQNYQNMLHFQHSNRMLPNEFLLIHPQQDLLYMPHPLFQIDSFMNKRH